MKGWKIALLILIGLLFVITSTIAIIWYSVSATALNANTYKKLITTDTIKQFAGNQVPPELLNNLDPFLSVFRSYVDSIFDYLNSKTDKIVLLVPNDDLIKPVMMTIAKQTYPEASLLTDEQFNVLFDQQYPTVKQELQAQLDNASLTLEQQLKDPKEIISFANTIAMILLIVSLVLLVFVVLLIRQFRSIFNWIGSYLLISGLIVTILGIGIISMTPLLLGSIPDQTIIPAATSMISGLISPIIIVGAIVAIIGLAMLFIKYAFKKPEEQPTK